MADYPSTKCKGCGIDGVFSHDYLCGVCVQDAEMHREKSKLKLYSAIIVYADRTLKGTWLTLLDVDETAAKKACIKQVHVLNRHGPDRGPIGRMEVTEIQGPFVAGQILHSEG